MTTRADKATSVRWLPVPGRGASRALTVARDVASRLRDPALVELAVEAAKRGTKFPRSVHWRPESLWQGDAGLAVLWASMDACFPDEGWDRVGLEHVRRAGRAIEQAAERRTGPGPGLSGLAGLATAAWSLSRGGARYRRLLSALDTTLAPAVEERAAAILDTRSHGVGVSTFDVISGLTGSGRYLLLRADERSCRRALESVLDVLVYLSEEDADGVPHLYTRPRDLGDSFLLSRYPNGNVNLGMAHGLPGPLALLSLAAIQGVERRGQAEAIGRMADRLCGDQIEDHGGVNFPTAVAVGSRPLGSPPPELTRGGTPEDRPAPSRAAWCYGTPGVARALWLAGAATDRFAYRDLAVAAMEAVYGRPVAARRIDSPTLCHGVAGLLQVTLRFANDTRQPVFVDEAGTLLDQVLSAYEPDTILGYRSTEPSENRIDQPGFLDGAAGVALVLLAASTPVEPVWDSALLLS